MRTETLIEIEQALKAESRKLAAGLAENPPITKDGTPIPSFYISELAIRLLLANLANVPVGIFERARDEHRTAEHGGENGGDQCEACGYLDAALYQAKTGRHLAVDFLGEPPR